jgi:hypothetical protein
MIANIASDDALILPHRANPGGLEFSGTTGLAIDVENPGEGEDKVEAVLQCHVRLLPSTHSKAVTPL